MKKLLKIVLVLALVLGISSCADEKKEEKDIKTQTENTQKDEKKDEKKEEKEEGKEEDLEGLDELGDLEGEFITIKVANEKNEMIDLEVLKDPKRIVVLDFVALDTLHKLGLGDRIVGLTKRSVPKYLSEYVENTDIKDLGSIREVDMEEMMSLEPDIIFSSGRTMKKYKEFSEIAPTVMTAMNHKEGFYKSFKENAKRNASIFGLGEKLDEIISGYDKRIETLKEAADGKTAIIALATKGNISTLGNNSRCSIIGVDLAFENLANDVDSTHGNTASFELLVEKNPDYLFVLDRDTAISAEGAVAAEKLLDNEIVHKTDAYKNKNIVYLNPSVWYLAEGGLEALDIMLKDLEKGILK